MIGAGMVALGVALVRYYNPFFLVSAVLLVAGAVLLYQIDSSLDKAHRIGIEIMLGSSVGALVLGNVLPCHTELQEKDHSVANGLAFLSSSLGA